MGRPCRGGVVPGAPAIARSPRGPRPPQRETGKRLRINDQIRISPVRLIDENNEQVGVVDVDDAKRRARDAGLDLVEVSGASRPPVVRIMDYGKWKYAQQKKEQKAKSQAKKSELKGMRLRPNIDDHDLGLKVKKAREFLEDGDKVQFVMLFRGRQMAHKDLARNTMLDVFSQLKDVGKIEQDPKMMGRRMTMLLAPDRKTAAPKPKEPGETPAPEPQNTPA
jgi:translation initiation factor IF-3